MSSTPDRDKTMRHTPVRKPQPKPRRPGATRSANKKAGGVVPSAFTNALQGKRLQRVLAEAGVASRRDCEAMIASGHVTVNGQLVTALPAWVDPTKDRIELDGHAVAGPGRQRNKNVYVAVHKPTSVVSTSRDPEGRQCVTDLVNLPVRLFPVGRLDADSSGLMLLTNDGTLANRLAHPRYEVPKQYRVSVRGHVSQAELRELRTGIYLAHLKALPQGKALQVKRASVAQVKILGLSRDKARGDRTQLQITLREGQNREIRRMLARLGHKVRRLERVAIGPIKLKGLAVGHWRPLAGREINILRRAAGLRSASQSS